MPERRNQTPLRPADERGVRSSNATRRVNNPRGEGGIGLRRAADPASVEPVTRATGRTPTVETDPNTGEEYVTARSRTGRLIDKNRSDGWRGYRTHLTARQRRLIAWALRQRDRGCTREAIWIKLQEVWQPSPMQYPLSVNTIASWELTRASQRSRGREWPIPAEGSGTTRK